MAQPYLRPNRPPPSNDTAQEGDGGGRHTENEQLSLSPSFHWSKKGGEIRALLNRAIEINRISHRQLAEDTEIDEKQIGRILRDGGGAHPPLALVACVMWQDKAGVFLAGLAEKLGYEVRPKAPDLAADNRRLRNLLAEATRLLQEAQS